MCVPEALASIIFTYNLHEFLLSKVKPKYFTWLKKDPVHSM
jgi:hypothetical protein